MSQETILAVPSLELIQSFLDYATQMLDEKRESSISRNMDYIESIKSKDKKVQSDLSAIEKYPEGYIKKLLDMEKGIDLQPSYQIPRTTFWVAVHNEVVGQVNIKHFLKDEAARKGIKIPGYTLGQDFYGSNIGYSIKTSQRGKGYASSACELALRYCCESLKLENVMITCNGDNTTSRRVIEKNGGIQTPPFITKNNEVKLRFKIDLTEKFGL